MPSSCTLEPVTGPEGEKVNDAAGAGGELTIVLGAEVLDADPPALVAVTTTSTVCPVSPLVSV
jgi:hypothetical protein